MSCIVNINRFIIPNDIVSTITTIYKYIGKNEIYEKTVGNDINRIVEQTIEKDCYYIAKIFNLDASDNRMRLIVTKNSSPRTKDETMLYRLKEVLTMIQMKHHDLTTQSNDLINIANYINPNQNIKFAYQEENKKVILKSQSMRSKRILLDEINDIVNTTLRKEAFEKIILYIHFFIDFYNFKPFTEENETTAFVLFYLLLFKAEVYAFKYVSFFEYIYKNKDRFITELKNASFNWNEGYAQTLGFVRFFTKLINEAYQNNDDIIKAYEFDQNINKSDNIENTIYKLPNIFSKEEIRTNHPLVSESTINRTLSKLRDEKCIKPLGKGRSAKWIKIK